MNGFANALIRATTADQFRHDRVNFGIAGIFLFLKQSSRGHGHSRLAVAALRDVFLQPGTLARMISVKGKPLDSCVVLISRGGQCDLTGADSPTVLMNSAGPANARAASVFGSGQMQQIAERPKQGHLRIGIQLMPLSIDGKKEGRHNSRVNNRTKSGREG